jgi:6-phosphogluconate dehydrogenase
MSNFEFGIVGLGVMGRNFLLNMVDHNFSVVGLDLPSFLMEITSEIFKKED